MLLDGAAAVLLQLLADRQGLSTARWRDGLMTPWPLGPFLMGYLWPQGVGAAGFPRPGVRAADARGWRRMMGPAGRPPQPPQQCTTL